MRPHPMAFWFDACSTRARCCAYEYAPSSSSRAPSGVLVVFLHGIGEHASRYLTLFHALTAAGHRVMTYDCVGHGASEGLPGYISSFDDVVGDAAGFCARARASRGARAVVLVGQSFGGLIAATVCANDREGVIDGLVLTAASIDVRWTAVLRAQAAMGRALAACAPKARLVPAVRLEDMSDDAATVESYASDPWVQIGPVRCKTAYEILRGFRALRERYGDVRCRLLAMHGAEDACADKDASARLVREASSRVKEYVELPGMHHLILQEPGSAAVIRRVVDFASSFASDAERRSKL